MSFLFKVPAFLNITDIAGLVKGASEGQGLGNAFLSHIKVRQSNQQWCGSKSCRIRIHLDPEVFKINKKQSLTNKYYFLTLNLKK